MTLQSIEKYFERYTEPKAYPWVSEMLLDIQDEVDSSYMLLPVDADGVPIKPGDCVRGLEGENADARFVTIHCDGTYDVGSRGWQPHYLQHVNPRTVEDVLTDFANEVARQGHQIGLTGHELVMRYADEICELMEVDR